MKIKEIIVVEGKDDTVAIRRAVDADTIETNGSALNDATIKKIQLAAEKRGVIIFTDPDFPGEKIRKAISEKVPNCKHAFLPKDQAKAKSGKGIGVEHASVVDIQNALKDAQIMNSEVKEQISREDLIDLGFIGDQQAKFRRERLGELLRIGYTNGKQLHKRLQVFEISRETFIEAVRIIDREEPLNDE